MHSDEEKEKEEKKEKKKVDKMVEKAVEEEVEVGRSSPKIIGKDEEGYDSDEAWF